MIDGFPEHLVVATAVAMLGLFVGVANLDRWMQDRDQLRTRLLTQVGSGLRSSGPAGVRRLVAQLRGVLDEFAGALGAHRWLRPSERDKTLRLLRQAGFRSHAAIVRYTAIKVVLALAGFALAIAVTAKGHAFADRPVVQIALVLGAAFAGGLVPEMVVGFLSRRRTRAIVRSLPDALDLMIIVANTGQSLDMALDRVTRELAESAPEIADEFEVTMSELRGLASRREALDNLAKRTGLREIRSFTATLIQTVQYGTPLSVALKTLADEMRQARLLQIEEQAARLPAILSMVLMLLIMPSLFIVTGGPAVMSLLDAFGN